jgi:HEPN domain-containing protein
VAAAARVPGAVPATLCFLCQQAAEKAIKAVPVSRGTAFSRTHNVGSLLDLVPSDIAISPGLQQAALLTRYATDTRYPGTHERPTWEDYEKTLRLAQAVVSRAEKLIGRRAEP